MYVGDRSSIEKAGAFFLQVNNSPSTVSLLRAKIPEICSSEGEEKFASHSALLLRMRACMIVYMNIRIEKNHYY